MRKHTNLEADDLAIGTAVEEDTVTHELVLGCSAVAQKISR
jgi:hypothetical protein